MASAFEWSSRNSDSEIIFIEEQFYKFIKIRAIIKPKNAINWVHLSLALFINKYPQLQNKLYLFLKLIE